MSINKNRGRHRAHSNIWTTIAQVSPVKARTLGGTAAAVVAGSGLMFGMAAPAQAGVIANDPAPAPAAAAAAPAAAPAAATVAETVTQTVTEAAATHTVVPGDTLGQIAATYGVSLDSILALNGLSMTSIIYPGDVITYAGTAAVQPAASYAPVETAAAIEAAPAAASFTDPGTYTTLSTQVTPAAPSAGTSAIGQIMVNAAYSQLGATQDCTVLVEVALRAAGHSVGDLAPAQLAAYGTPVSDPQPGDMVYYADGGMGFAHIAIYIGDGQAIHSGWNGNQTVVQSVNVGSGPVYYRA
ncbi:LysM peptidoglycan-binding domain-containing protein [Arthrobacter sp. Sa2CUA1]|uniref:LysM peptidoglycan-binding domain-containing protein n=1 Tax=Arthrobacter gallicola TaxID=2762225 RepID=A0ABR8UN73_9MICC|nr:LysM peptidoglycan-binding domain-containing protein [Arthrobacter gallicola]MBD7994001.1 LysM peptidoglycan-binding domain-containing protein [Arthrobacter gallicola]